MAVKTISNSDAIRLVREMWPALSFAWVPDQNFLMPVIEEVIALIQVSGVKDFQRYGESWDCDDFALWLHAWVNQHHPPNEDKFPWAFGEVTGSRFKNIHEQHSLNICLSADGVYLIEPQTYGFWVADPKQDRVWAIKL